MASKIKIEIGDYLFVARLLEEEAPETCRAFKEVMPIEGHVIQARWSGEAVWFPMNSYGIEVSQENATSHPSRGDILYYPGGKSEKEMLIPYGSACFSSKVGQLHGNFFAIIIEGVNKLDEMGKKVLWEGAQNIRITLK
jgi:hypothetical protein